MKINSAALLLSTVLLACCKPETTPPVQETTPKVTTYVADIEAEEGKLKGLWLSDEYLNRIEKLRSVYNAGEEQSMTFGFTIEPDSLDAKKLFFNTFSKNEGGPVGVLAYDEAKKKFVHLSSGEEHESIKQSFDIQPIDENQLVLNLDSGTKEAYRRITDIDGSINKILFEGAYIEQDTGNEVVFKANGTISGLPDKGFYTILYAFDNGYVFDTVLLALTEKREDSERYHFTIKNDILKLYTILEDENEVLTIGPLAYTFTKK